MKSALMRSRRHYTVTPAIRKLALEMHHELNRQRLDVVLSFPRRAAHPGHMVRVVNEQNPDWYRKFCASYESSRSDLLKWRKFKTLIKRSNTLRGLLEISSGIVKSVYANRLISVVEREYTACLEYVPF